MSCRVAAAKSRPFGIYYQFPDIVAHECMSWYHVVDSLTCLPATLTSIHATHQTPLDWNHKLQSNDRTAYSRPFRHAQLQTLSKTTAHWLESKRSVWSALSNWTVTFTVIRISLRCLTMVGTAPCQSWEASVSFPLTHWHFRWAAQAPHTSIHSLHYRFSYPRIPTSIVYRDTEFDNAELCAKFSCHVPKHANTCRMATEETLLLQERSMAKLQKMRCLHEAPWKHVHEDCQASSIQLTKSSSTSIDSQERRPLTLRDLAQ